MPAIVDHSGFYRGLLVFGSLAIPVFGLVEWGIGYNPFGVRLGLGAAGLLLYGASYRSEALRRNLRVVVLLFCHVLFLWFSYIAHRHNMTANDVIGLLPIVIGIAVVIRRPAELVASITFMVIVLTISYQRLAAPVLDLSATGAVLSTFAAVLGSMSVWRTRLEEQLQIANTTLEERVRERTARLEREVEERARAEARANAANEAKSRFLANMSHELRTPLNAVIGYTDLVEEELASTGQAHLCEDLGRVGSAATHLLAIIDDILDLSQIESGRLEIRREAVKLRAAVDDALLLVKPALALQQNRLLVDVSEELVVAGEHGSIVRVLVHLLDNAAKFTQEGEVEVRAERSGEWVDVSVRDSGIGIPEEARAELFDRFTQADTSAARVHDGLGLGLAICRELVDRLGGSITVTSAVGEGSVFTVRLGVASGEGVGEAPRTLSPSSVP